MQRSIYRFASVGVANTLIDISLYVVLRKTGLAILLANVFSTSAALTFSFTANRLFTFRAKQGRVKTQMMLFFPITIFGLWVLQPLCISLLTAIDGSISLFSVIPIPHSDILLPKIGATVVSFVWNYLMYRHVVFRDSPVSPSEQ